MRKFNLFLVVVLFLFPSLVFAETQQTQKTVKGEYYIAPNDLLEISVYNEPDLTKTVRVGADGTISYPLLGTIAIKGCTSKELETRITELLAQDYLISPQVSVFVKEHAKISVLGQVRSPGTYELKGGLTVIDAISLAGGFTEKANTQDVKLVRMKGVEKETININANDVITKGEKYKDVNVEPGDLVIVGGLESPTETGGIAETPTFVVVLGKVRSPGRYAFKKGMSIIDAVAMAGGLTDTASPNGTKIMRMRDGKKIIIQVPLGQILQGSDQSKDIELEADDTIVVPESFF